MKVAPRRSHLGMYHCMRPPMETCVSCHCSFVLWHHCHLCWHLDMHVTHFTECGHDSSKLTNHSCCQAWRSSCVSEGGSEGRMKGMTRVHTSFGILLLNLLWSILFDAMNCFLNLILDCSLLLCRNQIGFHRVILCPATLMNSFISSNGFSVGTWGFSVYEILSSANRVYFFLSFFFLPDSPSLEVLQMDMLVSPGLRDKVLSLLPLKE